MLSLDSDDSVKINFIKIFCIENINNNVVDIKYIINYIKSYVIKNYFIYNIKYFEGNNDIKFFALSLNDGGSLNDMNNNSDDIFKFDKIMDNKISIINCEQIRIDFNN